ncbi:MAG: hypothetical protein ACK559_24360, partial [bacterium]
FTKFVFPVISNKWMIGLDSFIFLHTQIVCVYVLAILCTLLQLLEKSFFILQIFYLCFLLSTQQQ